MGITQRMLPVTLNVTDSYKTLWGTDEDGVLNGGTRLTALVNNQCDAQPLTVRISVKATRESAFVPNAVTVNVPANAPPGAGMVNIALTGLSGYAIRLEGKFPPGTQDYVETSVQVEQ